MISPAYVPCRRPRESGVEGHANARLAAACCGTSQPVVRAVDAVAPRRSRFRSTPTTRDGIRFASRGEAELYDHAKKFGVVVVPHVRYPLHVLTSPGQPVSWFTPDLTLLAPVTYTTALDCFSVTVWEFKGPRACESRDYALRAKAFRATYPSIPLRVWRKVKGRLVEDSTALSASARGG